jgi:hypothetical protein
MANTQAAFGFQHVGFLPGYAPDYQLTRMAIQSSYATKIWFGDPVIKSASSQYIQPATGTGNLTAIAGIFQGCWYVPSAGGAPVYSPWWPASQQSDATALILAAPGAIFKAAALLTAIPATAIGQNIGFSTGAGGTTYGLGLSTFTVDQSTLTTGSTAPFQVVDLVQSIGNGSDSTTSYNWVIVTFNNQRFRAGQSGVA